MYNLVYLSPDETFISLFQIFTITHNETMNILSHVSVSNPYHKFF